MTQKGNFKYALAFILITMLIALTGYTINSKVDDTNKTSQREMVLWVVTEETDDYGMNLQAEILKNQFEETHDQIKIRLDILPSANDERTIYLDKLRTQIMAGEGPDAYLLPVTESLKKNQLFKDVKQAMDSGHFADVSQYYDCDEELCVEGLLKKVMDAGTVGDKRYVLPLRYDIPIVCADTEMLASSGFTLEQVSDIETLMNTALELNDPLWTVGAVPMVQYKAQDTQQVGYDLDSDGEDDFWMEIDGVPYSSVGLSYLGCCIDYTTGRLLLTSENLAEFMQKTVTLYNSSLEMESRRTSSISKYISHGFALGTTSLIQIDKLSNAMDYAAIAGAEDRSLEIMPLKATTGELVANVTYYAAVGSGCDYPEVAYEYLRMFLTEESQWEKNMIEQGINNDGLVENGWPVRAKGATEHLWEVYRKQYINLETSKEGQNPRKRKILTQRIADNNISVLEAEIDSVRFQIPIEWETFGSVMYDLLATQPEELTDTNYIALAENLIHELEWHLAEG